MSWPVRPPAYRIASRRSSAAASILFRPCASPCAVSRPPARPASPSPATPRTIGTGLCRPKPRFPYFISSMPWLRRSRPKASMAAASACSPPKATLEAGIYPERLARSGLSCRTPDAGGQAEVTRAIRLVKARTGRGRGGGFRGPGRGAPCRRQPTRDHGVHGSARGARGRRRQARAAAGRCDRRSGRTPASPFAGDLPGLPRERPASLSARYLVEAPAAAGCSPGRQQSEQQSTSYLTPDL